MSNPQGEATAWSYLDNNWLKSQQLDNGAKTSFSYNTLGQMTGLTNRNGANAILSQFGHDNVVDSMLIRNGEGSVTQVKALLASASNLGGTTNYSYDVKSQLLGESSTRGSAISDTFNYDNAGNPTTWNLNAQSLTRTFNSNNQETTLNAGGSAQFDYDGNGNPTLYKNVATGFDVANHLTSYGTTFSAGYRSDGKRAWKANSSGTRTYFLYDGDAIVAELDANGAVTFTNTWGANGLISRRDEVESSTRFYLWDERGSAAQRLDSSGAVIGSYSFTAWGKRSGGTGGDPYTGFGGQYGYYTDYETGLILCTHRYYDVNNGRWLTRDPIGYSGGINLYGYVTNDVTNLADPYGLMGSAGQTPAQRAVSQAWDQGFRSGLGDLGSSIGRGLGKVGSFIDDMAMKGAFIPADVQQGQQIAATPLPSYVAANIGYNNIMGGGLGTQFILDCHGNGYWGRGPSAGSPGLSWSVVLGYPDKPTSQNELFDFLRQRSSNVTVGYWGVGVGRTRSGSDYSTEIGVMSPQIGWNPMYDYPLFGPNVR